MKKNHIKISNRSLGKKIVLSFQSSELSIEFGTAIARTFGAIAQWVRNIFEVAFTFYTILISKVKSYTNII